MPRQHYARQWVYFIGAGDEAVKIGIATDLAKRLSGLQCGNHLPLRLLAAFETTNARNAEGNFHLMFLANRMCGEWFAPNAALKSAIDRILASDVHYLAEFNGTGRICTPEGFSRSEIPWEAERGASAETHAAIMAGAAIQLAAVDERFGIRREN